MARSGSMLLAALLALTVVTSAAATDQPISGKKLQLKRNATNGTWTFVSKDGAFPFPAIGGPDDPETAGALIEIVPTPGSPVVLAIPPGTGSPGWSGKVGKTSRLKFVNPQAPAGASVVRTALFRQGKQIKIMGRSLAGLTFGPTTTAMALRITTGSLRSCVRFGPSTIRRADTSIFVALDAAADSLPDCSDEALGIGPPCGSTAPTCNGTCPAGESCNEVGNGCVCLPDGATPCGSPGAPTCGGACPSGEVCRPIMRPPSSGGVGCGCGAPTPCDEGGIECANGVACALMPGVDPTCLPMACGGECGQPCGDGGACSPIYIAGNPLCVCAVPAPCCDGGYVCPPLQTCVLPTINTCGGCQ